LSSYLFFPLLNITNSVYAFLLFFSLAHNRVLVITLDAIFYLFHLQVLLQFLDFLYNFYPGEHSCPEDTGNSFAYWRNLIDVLFHLSVAQNEYQPVS